MLIHSDLDQGRCRIPSKLLKTYQFMSFQARKVTLVDGYKIIDDYTYRVDLFASKPPRVFCVYHEQKVVQVPVPLSQQENCPTQNLYPAANI